MSSRDPCLFRHGEDVDGRVKPGHDENRSGKEDEGAHLTLSRRERAFGRCGLRLVLTVLDQIADDGGISQC